MRCQLDLCLNLFLNIYSNNQCSFLLNCSLLSGLFAVLSVLAAGYQIYLSYRASLLIQAGMKDGKLIYFIPINLSPDIYIQRVFVYIIIAIGSLLAAWFFYNASLLNVSQYGNMIRSTYDLFRFKLLDQFRLESPKDLEAERDRWDTVCEFINIGDENGPIYLEYTGKDKGSTT